MNDALPIVAEQLMIAAPCSKKWEEMHGDHRRRYCGDCRLFVYNVPELTPEALVRAIESSEGDFCGRLYTRADGTVMTEDCPVGHAARARRKVIAAFAFVTTLVATALGVARLPSVGAAGPEAALTTSARPAVVAPAPATDEAVTTPPARAPVVTPPPKPGANDVALELGGAPLRPQLGRFSPRPR